MKTLNGHQIRQYREAAGLSRPALIRLLDRMEDADGPRFTGWTVKSLTNLENNGVTLSVPASAEFFRAFSMAPDAGSEHTAATGRGSVVCDNSRIWVAVRQTPAFAVALDIARQERRSKIQLDQIRSAYEAVLGGDDEEAHHDAYIAARQAYRNDNNVLWGAARMLAAMVDNDDELGALLVLRDELDRQDAGQPA